MFCSRCGKSIGTQQEAWCDEIPRLLVCHKSPSPHHGGDFNRSQSWLVLWHKKFYKYWVHRNFVVNHHFFLLRWNMIIGPYWTYCWHDPLIRPHVFFVLWGLHHFWALVTKRIKHVLLFVSWAKFKHDDIL